MSVLTHPAVPLFTEARTVNSFADTPVSDEQLSEIWELTRWSPTTANSQPLRALFIRTPGAKERLLPLLLESNQAKAASAPVVAVLAYDPDFHQHFDVTFPARAEALGALFGGMGEEVRAATSKHSAAVAAGVFLLAVRAQGLAAGPMGGFDAPGVDREFLGGTTWRSHLVVNIGHPGENPWFDRLPRLSTDRVVKWL